MLYLSQWIRWSLVVLLHWSFLLLFRQSSRWRWLESCVPVRQRPYKYSPEDMDQFSEEKQVYMCEKVALCWFKT